MLRPGTRSTWIILALLATAALLLTLSFVSWGEATAVAAIPATPTRSPAEIGRALFALKGCATCHRHDGLDNERLTRDGQAVPASQSMGGMSGAPNLSRYQPDPDFVRAWLKDPKAIRPKTLMPNLGLSEDEIEALLAFLQTTSATE